MDIARLRVVIEGDDSGLIKIEASANKAQTGVARMTKDANAQLQALRVSAAAASLEILRMATGPIIALGRASVTAAVDMDSLKRGLTAVSGSAKLAEDQLKQLQEVAKLPGLGLQEAIRGSINLQAAGFSAKQARESLAAFGNALATVGKGKADLDGVILALTQIASKGKISAEEINQLAERVPQIRKVMQDAFGTANTEFIQQSGMGAEEFVRRVTRELQKLKPVTGGMQNDFENAQDSINQSLERIGQAVTPMVSKFLKEAVPAVEKLTKEFRALPDSTQQSIVALGIVGASAGPAAMAARQIGALASSIGITRAAIMGPGGLIVAVTALVASLATLSYKSHVDAIAQEVTKDAVKPYFITAEERVRSLRAELSALEAGAEAKARQRGGSGADTGYMAATGSLLDPSEAAKSAQLKRDIAEWEGRAGQARARAEVVNARLAELARKAAAEAAKNAAKGPKDTVVDLTGGKGAKEAARHAEDLKRRLEQIQEELAQATLNRFDFERWQARKAYEEDLRLGVGKAKAQELLSARLREIMLEEGRDHQRVIDEMTRQDAEYSEMVKKRLHAALPLVSEGLARISEGAAQAGVVTRKALEQIQEEYAKIRRKLETATKHSNEIIQRFNEEQAREWEREQKAAAEEVAKAKEKEAATSMKIVGALQDQASAFDALAGRTDYYAAALAKLNLQNEQLTGEQKAAVQTYANAWRELDRIHERQKLIADTARSLQGVFSSAFTEGIQNAKSFFSVLAKGFKDLIVRQVSDVLAGFAVKELMKLFGVKQSGLADSARSARNDILIASVALGASAAALKEAAKEARKAAEKQAIVAAGSAFGPEGAAIGALFSGFFADGGTVPANHWAIVGERGPEIIQAGSQPVTVTPNASGRAVSVVQNFYGDLRSDGPSKVSRELRRSLALGM